MKIEMKLRTGLKLTLRFLLVALLSACIACEAPSDIVGQDNPIEGAKETENLTTIEAPLDSTSGANIELLTDLMNEDNAGIVLRSYAITKTTGCTGWMISPSILVHSAHCGFPNKVSFRRYRGPDPKNYVDEYFTCNSIIASSYFAEDLNGKKASDFMAYWCDPNAAGERPGDKYGYLDIDPRKLKKNEELLRIWRNNVVDQGLNGGTRLVSFGKVTDPAADCVYNCPYGKIGVSNSVPVVPGGSGSPILDPETLKVVAGPTSTGNKSGSHANGMWGTFEKMNIHTWPKGLVKPFLTGENTGKSNSIYTHPQASIIPVNGDGDRIIDLIQLYEEYLPARDMFFTRFDLKARDILWEQADAPNNVDLLAEIEPWDGAGGSLLFLPTASFDGLDLSGLALKANTTYRITLKHNPGNATKSDSSWFWFLFDFEMTQTPNQAHIALRSETSACPDVVSVLPLGHEGVRRDTVTLRTGNCSDYRFSYGISSIHKDFSFYSQASLYDLAIIEDGTAISFDNADQREGWNVGLGGENAKHSLITAEGINSTWAGIVESSGSEWNEKLMNWWVALKANSSYDISFKTRPQSEDAHDPYFLVRSDEAFFQGENNVLFAEFDPGASWAWTPHGHTVNTGGHADYRISFGEHYNGRYAVDEITISDTTQLTAQVDIEHTYRGDLIVEIGVGDPSQPLWQKKLWNGEGNSAQDLHLTVDVSDASAYFPPQPGQPWYIKIHDQYNGDQGQLVHFSVEGPGGKFVSTQTPEITDKNTSQAWIMRAMATTILDHPNPTTLELTMACWAPGKKMWIEVEDVLNFEESPVEGQVIYRTDLSEAVEICQANPDTGEVNLWLIIEDQVWGGEGGELVDFAVTHGTTTRHTADNNTSFKDTTVVTSSKL